MYYYYNLNTEIKEYFKILEPKFPEWLHEYINTKELLMQQHISVTCGTIYSDLFESNFFFSSLDHSVAVALIIWHFTNDKKQTLSGLFHDIATPAFKHCIDFLNGDYLNQESTEDLTKEIIKNSSELAKLLKRDKIEISEVNDYHIYPIADNDTPKLSADRLEYSLSNSLLTYRLLDLQKIQEIYDDIDIQTNEENAIELGFKTKKIAREFVKATSKLSLLYREDKTRYSMQFLADIIKRLNEENKITIEDLYKLKESEVIQIIEKSRYNEIFNKWKHATQIKTSKTEPKNVYYVHQGVKTRYIDPLCQGQRMSKACKIANKMISNNLAYKMDNMNIWRPRPESNRRLSPYHGATLPTELQGHVKGTYGLSLFNHLKKYFFLLFFLFFVLHCLLILLASQVSLQLTHNFHLLHIYAILVFQNHLNFLLFCLPLFCNILFLLMFLMGLLLFLN